jgi:hypothetical protein
MWFVVEGGLVYLDKPDNGSVASSFADGLEPHQNLSIGIWLSLRVSS